jgi:predicted peptidase
LPANSNVINKWLRGNVKTMMSPATTAPLGYTWNADAYKAYIYKTLPFRLKFPRTYDPNAVDGKKYPMIIFFHGLGEVSYNAVPEPKADSIGYFMYYDNEWQLLWGGDHPFLGAVNNTGPDGYDGYILFMQLQIYGWDVQQYTALKEISDYMVINNKLDPFAVTCTGLSGGALAAWAMMTAHPSLISGSVPMSGASAGVLNDIEKFKFTPVWLFQGGNDANPG